MSENEGGSRILGALKRSLIGFLTRYPEKGAVDENPKALIQPLTREGSTPLSDTRKQIEESKKAEREANFNPKKP